MNDLQCNISIQLGINFIKGLILALIEAKLALARAVQAVEFSTIDKTEIPLKLRAGATLSPANSVYVGIKK
ncbi:hypothetical protein TrispH2_009696 [Trichoplax sp. H2]|nr:hypothetical protein TrispH2_009696 [Trichoplax sp. H2]|eukprot:RDD37636.1 hypothetical protein TrispH2_009696 [Trichoplax sp. H2]